MDKSIQKYLTHYAEIESQDIVIKSHVYDCVIVIPICHESLDCLNTVFSEIIENNLLVILVVNSPVGDKNLNRQANNQLFINKLRDGSSAQCHLNKYSQLLKFQDFNDVLIIDRNSEGLQIHSKQGVGMARKIGCDVALKLFALGLIKMPWIFSTDADVILPENYFKNPALNSNEYSAVVLDFEHFSTEQPLSELQFYYDFKLRYYHAGIKYAHSYYDYIPLGSTLIISMMAYAQVRGFPKRNAGEDFYLLNKLAKVKPVNYLQDETVKIKSRFSNRVPFGTGPALTAIKALNSVDEYKYYNPQCFMYLNKWQNYLAALYGHDGLSIDPPKEPLLIELYGFFNCQNLFEKSSHQITNRQRWSQFMLQWFDAFRTLKAVHFFDKKFPRLNYKQLLKAQNFAKVSHSSLQHFMHKYDKN